MANRVAVLSLLIISIAFLIACYIAPKLGEERQIDQLNTPTVVKEPTDGLLPTSSSLPESTTLLGQSGFILPERTGHH